LAVSADGATAVAEAEAGNGALTGAGAGAGAGAGHRLDDVVGCLCQGDLWACGSPLMDAIPWTSVFSKGK
jgi:hypothetical protein